MAGWLADRRASQSHAKDAPHHPLAMVSEPTVANLKSQAVSSESHKDEAESKSVDRD